MAALLILFSLLAYALAALLLWRERTWRAPLLLVAGALTVVLLPFWFYLYRMVPVQSQAADLLRVDTTIATIFGGPLVVLPVLLFCAGLSQRLWSRHYGFIWIAYAIFTLYFLLLVTILIEIDILPSLALLGLREQIVLVIVALLLAGVGLSIVFTLIGTRDYPIIVAVLAVTVSGLLGTALFWGLLGSPLWAVRFFGFASLPPTAALALLAGTALLVVWGVHLIASVLHAGRRLGFTWH